MIIYDQFGFLIYDPKMIEVQDSVIGKGRRHCWTQFKFIGPFLILHHIAIHLGQEYFLRDIYVYSTRIHNKFLSPIYQLDSNTEAVCKVIGFLLRLMENLFFLRSSFSWKWYARTQKAQVFLRSSLESLKLF